MKNVIVFGGAGFLGSHVCDELSKSGYKVRVFDINKSPYCTSEQEMIVGDILNLKEVQRAVEGCSIVYNFAGLADINDAKNNPIRTAELNIMGHLNILEACKTAKVERFVYASTVYVYSESGSFYRVSKQAGERFTETYQEKYNLPFTILRYGSLYGRRADNRNAIYRFIESALKTKEISYQGTGEELREYIHVQDAATASVDILTEQYKNTHMTITGNQQYRIKDVMLMISEMLADKKVAIKFDNDFVEAHYNITPYAYKPRVGKKLVMNPFVDIGQGILDCIHEIAELGGGNNKKS